MHDDEDLEDALRTVLQDGVDGLNGLDLLQFVAHFMAGQRVDAFEQVQVAIWQAHEQNVPEDWWQHRLSLWVVLVGTHEHDGIDLAEHEWH